MIRKLLTAAALLTVSAGAHAQSPARAQLVIVVDGLRPDYVTPELMPRLVRLGQRGIVFTAHHSVFPTVTRVNASSFVTGAYPETHGLLGNTIYIPSVNATKGLDTGSRENLEAVARAEGQLLTAPSLGEILQQAGKKLLGIGTGTSGAALLLNHTVAGGAIVHPEFTRPADLGPRLAERLGVMPPRAVPNGPQHRRAVDAYLSLGLDEMHPDVAFLWLSDPDSTAHARGVGTPPTLESLAIVDGEIGRVEDALRMKGLLDRTNIIVTSDHGFSTHTGGFRLDEFVAPLARTMPDGSRDIVVAEGAIYVRGAHDAARVAAIVGALQRHPEVGAIFTRAVRRGDLQGSVAGTLSFDLARWNHARSGDILVSANWTDRANDAGYKGTTTEGGTAGHGASSPYDIHNTLIAAGPDFRERATSDVPTGNVDIAPTLLRLLGVRAPATMSGRVIEEGLRSGPLPSSIKVERTAQTVKSVDESYELTAHLSTAGGRRYLDYTTVTHR
jgi:arylsulfatase A-like enzyme